MELTKNIKNPDDYYYVDKFDTFEEAYHAQRKKIQQYLDEGKVLRAVDFDRHNDYDTKKDVYTVFVRAFVFTSKDEEYIQLPPQTFQIPTLGSI